MNLYHSYNNNIACCSFYKIMGYDLLILSYWIGICTPVINILHVAIGIVVNNRLVNINGSEIMLMFDK